MSTNSSFDLDDFEAVPGIQPSGHISVSEAPQLSQSSWYHIEDDDEEDVIEAKEDRESEAPQLSQSSWYHIEDDDEEDAIEAKEDEEDDNARNAMESRDQGSGSLLQAGQNVRQPVNFGTQAVRRKNVSFASAGTNVSFASTAPRSAGSRQKFLSLRLILIIVVVMVMTSGVVLARSRVQSMLDSMGRPAPAATQPTRVQGQLTPSTSHPPIVTSTPPKAVASPTPKATDALAGQTLPEAWTASSRGFIDADEAVIVAETFVQRCQTLDFRSPATLNAPLFIMTDGAQARFAANDKCLAGSSIAQFEQNKIKQTALTHGARLVQAQKDNNGDFFAWVTVSYQLDIQQGQSNLIVMNNLHMTVLLLAVDFGTPKAAPAAGGIGWLVSDFQKGDGLPPIPA